MTAIPPQIAQLRATLQQALQHHQAGRLSEAERLYRSILKVRPGPEISNALGIALKGQGKPDDAAAAISGPFRCVNMLRAQQSRRCTL
jgi:Flp pilus assembly protein TadD